MVTLQNVDVGNRQVLELVGKSTDTFPTNATGGIDGYTLTNGSTLFEMDTSTAYMFDVETDTWVEII